MCVCCPPSCSLPVHPLTKDKPHYLRRTINNFQLVFRFYTFQVSTNARRSHLGGKTTRIYLLLLSFKVIWLVYSLERPRQTATGFSYPTSVDVGHARKCDDADRKGFGAQFGPCWFRFTVKWSGVEKDNKILCLLCRRFVCVDKRTHPKAPPLGASSFETSLGGGWTVGPGLLLWQHSLPFSGG